MNKYGDCSFCGGEVKEERAELDYRYKGNLFVFQNVPAGVCQQCGEKYLSGNVYKKLERMAKYKSNLKEKITVDVLTFRESAAA